MTTLTRAQAKQFLSGAGWPADCLDIMVAIGAQESSLRVDVTGPPNSDGTVDLGWLQINSRYVDNAPHFDRTRLLNDALYNAHAGLLLYHDQGYGAWVAYTSGNYKRYLPPSHGGPALAQSSPAWFLVADLQTTLNAGGWATPPLVADGGFGPKTQAALDAYQAKNPIEPHIVGPAYGARLGL